MVSSCILTYQLQQSTTKIYTFTSLHQGEDYSFKLTETWTLVSKETQTNICSREHSAVSLCNAQCEWNMEAAVAEVEAGQSILPGRHSPGVTNKRKCVKQQHVPAAVTAASSES